MRRVNCLPGLGDHDMAIAYCSIKPSMQKQTPRKVQIFRKADWSKLKSLMAGFRDFIQEHLGKSAEDMWNEFTTAFNQFSSQCIPTKRIRGKTSLPWITQKTSKFSEFMSPAIFFILFYFFFFLLAIRTIYKYVLIAILNCFQRESNKEKNFI